jgi:hypothetical protein
MTITGSPSQMSYSGKDFRSPFVPQITLPLHATHLVFPPPPPVPVLIPFPHFHVSHHLPLIVPLSLRNRSENES